MMVKKFKISAYFRRFLLAIFMLLPVITVSVKAQSVRYNEIRDTIQTSSFISTSEEFEPQDSYDSINVSAVPRNNFLNNLSNIPNDIIVSGSDLFSTANLPKLSLTAVSTVSFFSFDHTLLLATHREMHRSNFFKQAAYDAVFVGDGKWQLAAAGLCGLYGYIADDDKAIKISFEVTEAVISSGLTVQILKRIVGRKSPAVATSKRGRAHFMPSIKEYNQNQPKYYSYPSGHTTTAVAILTVISENYPESTWMKPVSYALTAALGVGLVSRNMHWYSDLPLAIFLGNTFGKAVVRHNTDSEQVNNQTNHSDVSLLTTYGLNGPALTLLINF